MRRFVLLGVVIISAAAGAQTAGAQAQASPVRADSLRLTRSEAIAMALANNPQLAVAREQTNQFRAARVTARAIPDPAVSASLDDQSGFFRSGSGGTKNVGAGLTIPFPEKLRLQGQVATGDVKAAEANYLALRQQLAAITSQAYDSLLVAIRHLQDTKEALQLSTDFLNRTQARFDAGMVPKLDVIKAKVDVAQATNDLISGNRDISNAQAALDRLIGRPLGQPVAAVDSLLIPAEIPALEQLEPIALSSRAELAGIAAQRRAAGSATTLSKEFWLPDLNLGVNRDLTPGAPSTAFSTGIAFPFPLLFWQHTKGDIAQAQSRERELAATERDLRAAIGEDVRTTYATATAALRQARYIADELLPAARDAFRAASASYAIGGSSAFEVIEARRTLLDAETQYTNALAEANTSRADLERAIGAPLSNIPLALPNAK
jgi:cobalt-zinc-cadmium efflux system outer membrane protein